MSVRGEERGNLLSCFLSSLLSLMGLRGQCSDSSGRTKPSTYDISRCSSPAHLHNKEGRLPLNCEDQSLEQGNNNNDSRDTFVYDVGMVQECRILFKAKQIEVDALLSAGKRCCLCCVSVSTPVFPDSAT